MRVWVYSFSTVMAEALASLIGRLGFQADLSEHAETEVALWAPSSISNPVPAPPSMPTLVLIQDDEAAVMTLLRKGYRGCLLPDDDGQQLKKALEAIRRGEIWANGIGISPSKGICLSCKRLATCMCKYRAKSC